MEKKPVLLYPRVTEKTSRVIETENKIVFVVSPNSTKEEIKREFERTYGQKVSKVNVVRTMKGLKVAYIKLTEAGKAADLAMRLKLL